MNESDGLGYDGLGHDYQVHTSKFEKCVSKCVWFSLKERKDYKELIYGTSKALEEKIKEEGYEEICKERCDILQNSRAFAACEKKESRKCLDVLGRDCPQEAKKICEKSPYVLFFAS
ncbi:hypothetical protein A9K97_gp432 [Tokyovirus A1]|uniref:hypothetical protein n=1 Tax=Tokyovirus A1 TaxID=1826170 RepID=UPI0007A9742A|nr:hypothetical protein A9K97_gp432 [Tokyovirus A1]BAU79919.1 hypothetical protein [Tokyovirus A1]